MICITVRNLVCVGVSEHCSRYLRYVVEPQTGPGGGGRPGVEAVHVALQQLGVVSIQSQLISCGKIGCVLLKAHGLAYNGLI